MSFPVLVERFKLSDFVIKSEYTCINLLYSFYPKQSDSKIAEISIPPFCKGQAKFGVFLKEFSILLNEMLVKWDRETVQRLYDESMQTLFPDDMADFELGFYEIRGYLYCTIQFSEEGHKKAWGCGWNGSSLARALSCAFIPPKRTMFQKTDPAIEEAAKQLEAIRRHPRRTTSLREYLEAGNDNNQDEHKDENKGK